MVQNQPQKGC